MENNNFIHKNVKKYKDIKNEYSSKKFILIELDFNKIKNKEDLFNLFKPKIGLPKDYYYNINAFNDIFYDYFDSRDSKILIILIRNISKKQNESTLSDTNLDYTIPYLLNRAIKYWKERKKYYIKVFVFDINKDKIKG